MASKLNIVVKLQHWIDTVPGQTFLNYAYSWGASVVILGALFKLTHLPGGNLMLFLGMGTEAFVFFLQAFDRPFDKNSVGKALPDDFETDEEIERAEGLVAGGQPVIINGGGVVGGPVVAGGPAVVGATPAPAVEDEECETPIVAGGPTVIGGGVVGAAPVVGGGVIGGPVVAGGPAVVGGTPIAAVEGEEGETPAVVGGPTVIGGGVVGGAPAVVGGVIGGPVVAGCPAVIGGGVVGGAPEVAAKELTVEEMAAATAAAAENAIAGGGHSAEETVDPLTAAAIGHIYDSPEGAETVEQEATKLASIIRLANDELLRRAQAVLSPEMEDATQEYITKLQTLNETLAKVDEQSARLTRDSQEMENLNRTLVGINKVYDLHFASISRQVTTIEDINEQTRQLASKIEEVNQIYTRMMQQLTIMTNPMGVVSAPAPAPAPAPTEE